MKSASAIPRSLFGRLVLILLGGLLAATFSSVYLLSRERIELMQRVNGFNLMTDIARIVSVLEDVTPKRRGTVLEAFESSFRHTSFPASVPNAEQFPPEAQDTRKAALSAVLRNALDRERQFVVAIEDNRYDLLVNVSVRLRDGIWVRFEHRLPHELVGWPRRVLLTLMLMVLSVVALSLLAVRWVTRPLSTLSEAAEMLGRDLGRSPLAETGPTEVMQATRAFNRMQRQLQRNLEERARILAAISHDLKTPITRLRLRSELIEDPDLRDRHVQDLREVEAMISSTIDFVHGGSARESSKLIDLPALLDSLCEDAREIGLVVSIAACPVDRLLGRVLSIKRCLGNLIDNATRYGGRAEITVECTAGIARLIVSDCGPGLPEEELDKVFEPFYRVEASRNRDTGGSGLGLSIARNIARDHGGELSLRNRPNGGLEAVLELPSPCGDERAHHG